MNYKEWSDEYFRDAENLLKTIRKYEKMLEDKNPKNLEKINSIIITYRNIYYDILNTGKLLLARANGDEYNAA